MAEITHRKNGNIRVVWLGLLGIQNSITWPKGSNMVPIESFTRYIDRFVAAVKQNKIDDELRGWLAGLDDFTHGRLVDYGLAKPRDPKTGYQ